MHLGVKYTAISVVPGWPVVHVCLLRSESAAKNMDISIYFTSTKYNDKIKACTNARHWSEKLIWINY